MKGHTHEDVDQVFSRLSTALGRTEAATLPKLLGVFEKSQRQGVALCGIELDEMFNWSKWMQECRMDMSKHSQPHQFLIRLDR